jgi:hypothetical protein
VRDAGAADLDDRVDPGPAQRRVDAERDGGRVALRPQFHEHHALRQRARHAAGRGVAPHRVHRTDVRQHLQRPVERLGDAELRGVLAGEPVRADRFGLVDQQIVRQRRVRPAHLEDERELALLGGADRDPARDERAGGQLDRLVDVGTGDQLTRLGERAVVDPARQGQQQVVQAQGHREPVHGRAVVDLHHCLAPSQLAGGRALCGY